MTIENTRLAVVELTPEQLTRAQLLRDFVAVAPMRAAREIIFLRDLLIETRNLMASVSKLCEELTDEPTGEKT